MEINLADDAWKLFVVFVAGVFVGFLISKSTATTARALTKITDFTRDERGHVISIIEKTTPSGE